MESSDRGPDGRTRAIRAARAESRWTGGLGDGRNGGGVSSSVPGRHVPLVTSGRVRANPRVRGRLDWVAGPVSVLVRHDIRGRQPRKLRFVELVGAALSRNESRNENKKAAEIIGGL